MKFAPFKHSALDPADPGAFQTLQLLPSRDLKGPIHCTLQHCSLNDDIRYEALSYTWGQSRPGHTVIVNDSQTLDVTPNCLQALVHLRRRFHRRTLWIDAICVDQLENEASKQERDRQVRIMGDIYRKAHKVLVWLGPGEPSTARTIARLKLIARVAAARTSTSIGSTALDVIERYLSKRMIKSDALTYAPRPPYQALASIIQSPWWLRAWTMQEQVLARRCDIHQGRKSISISDLRLLQFIRTYRFLTDGGYHFVHRARHNISLFRHESDLFVHEHYNPMVVSFRKNYMTNSLLEAAFLLEAELPIYKIYGIYGLLTTYCDLSLSPPDYNKSAEEVYQETVWAWVSSRRDLSILKLAARPVRIERLPSWVPAWDHEHPRFIRNSRLGIGRLSEGYGGGHFNWSYSGVSNSFFSSTFTTSLEGAEESIPIAKTSPGKLHVLCARYVGRVTHTASIDTPIQTPLNSPEYLYVHLRWCRLVHDAFSYSTEKYEEALHEMFRSIQYPGIYQLSLADGNDHRYESFRAWFKFMLYLDRDSRSATSEFTRTSDTKNQRDSAVSFYSDLLDADRSEDAMNLLEKRYFGSYKGREDLAKLARDVRLTSDDLARVRNHSLCMLDNDKMLAVTDYWCQQGDEIFIFPGTDSPFVLRKDPDEDCYRLLGPALVDRLLKIGYQKWRSEGNDLQDIVLV